MNPKEKTREKDLWPFLLWYLATLGVCEVFPFSRNLAQIYSTLKFPPLVLTIFSGWSYPKKWRMKTFIVLRHSQIIERFSRSRHNSNCTLVHYWTWSKIAPRFLPILPQHFSNRNLQIDEPNGAENLTNFNINFETIFNNFYCSFPQSMFIDLGI